MIAFQNHILKKKQVRSLKKKKKLLSRGICFSNVFAISFMYKNFDNLYITVLPFPHKTEKINVTFLIYKIVFNF